MHVDLEAVVGESMNIETACSHGTWRNQKVFYLRSGNDLQEDEENSGKNRCSRNRYLSYQEDRLAGMSLTTTHILLVQSLSLAACALGAHPVGSLELVSKKYIIVLHAISLAWQEWAIQGMASSSSLFLLWINFHSTI